MTAGSGFGVPITIALVIFCAQHSAAAGWPSRWLADLLGAPGKEPPAATPR